MNPPARQVSLLHVPIDANHPRWTDPTPSDATTIPSPHPSSLLARLEELSGQPLDLPSSLYREMMFWNSAYRRNLQPPAAEACPTASPESDYRASLAHLCTRFHQRCGRLPVLLDFGTGPFSTLRSLAESGLAEVTIVDAGTDDPGPNPRHTSSFPSNPVITCSGENLLRVFPEESFDLVFVQDALDQSPFPPLTWLNLVRLVALGGYLGQAHAIHADGDEDPTPHACDADRDPSGGLCLTGRPTSPLNLVSSLGLDRHSRCVVEATQGLQAGQRYAWTLFQRSARTNPIPEFFESALAQFLGRCAAADRDSRP